MTILQKPMGSGGSTTVEVVAGINLSGKTAIVTSGYAELGLETTRSLTSAGARLVVPYSDCQKAASALKDLERAEPEAMDLLDPGSIDPESAARLWELSEQLSRLNCRRSLFLADSPECPQGIFSLDADRPKSKPTISMDGKFGR